ncbi:MAG: hypothetical protein JXQ73_06100 [Phycisphaerae bacterium]|nr:hypothetical protein [Phycisphaerae bacterium]
MTGDSKDLNRRSDPAQPRATSADEARYRLETEKVVVRQRRTAWWIAVLLIATVLVLLGVGVRRDQKRRASAVNDMRGVAEALKRWMDTHGRLPNDLRDVDGEALQSVNVRFVYADAGRRALAAAGQESVALVMERSPHRRFLGEDGRAVLLWKPGTYQVIWMGQEQLAGQRRSEERRLEQERTRPATSRGGPS